MVKLLGADDNGRLTAQAKAMVASAVPAIPPAATRVSVLGDSLSALDWGANKGQAWWETALALAGGTAIACYAKAGLTLRDLVYGWDAQTQSENPSMSQVAFASADRSQTWLVMIGSNDALQTRSVSAFEADLLALLNAADAVGKRVVLVLPPRPLPSYADRLEDLTVLLDATRRIADQRSVALIDIWDEVGDAVSGLPDTWDQGDGQHLTIEAHESLGRLVAERIRQAIGGTAQSAAWMEPPFPLVSASGDEASTSDVVAVEHTSRDLFPSGAAHLIDLAPGGNPYIALTRMMSGFHGKTIRLTFAFEILDMDPRMVNREKRDSGLFVQAGGVPSWDFNTIWGGIKTAGSRGVVSVEHTFPVETPNTSMGFNIVVSGVSRATESDPPIRVRIGSVRVETVG